MNGSNQELCIGELLVVDISGNSGGHFHMNIVVGDLDGPAHLGPVHSVEYVDRPPQSNPMLAIYRIRTLTFGDVIVQS
jgi:hypothetical protein